MPNSRGQPNAADLVASGAIDVYVRNFRRCRDQNLASNCGDYAESRVRSEFRQADQSAINSIGYLGREAINKGNRYNQAGSTYSITDWSVADPALTQYRSGDRRGIQYRYDAVVTVEFVMPDGTVQEIPIRWIDTNNASLTRQDIQTAAYEYALSLADDYITDSERLEGAGSPHVVSFRIESAYRIRA